MSTKKLQKEVKRILKEKPFIIKLVKSTLGYKHDNLNVQVNIEDVDSKQISIKYNISSEDSSETGDFLINRTHWNKILTNILP